VFYRENAASYYLPEAYAFTNLWVEFPWLALMVLIFSAIFYPMVGFEVRRTRRSDECGLLICIAPSYLAKHVAYFVCPCSRPLLQWSAGPFFSTALAIFMCCVNYSWLCQMLNMILPNLDLLQIMAGISE
jgi:hypothetical protein